MRNCLTLFILISLITAACGSAGRSPGVDEFQAERSTSSAPEARAALPRQEGTQEPLPANSAAPVGRKIIQNADLDLESGEPENAQRGIAQIAETLGGYVVETSQRSSDMRSAKRDIISMTLRVPSDKFGSALEQIRSSVDRVVVETVKGQDVTEEFIDLEARITAKRAGEAQFMEIMKRSTTVADALNVQKELSEIRAEIERLEGRKRFLENQTSLSTIRLRIQSPTAMSSSGAGFGYRLRDAFYLGFDIAMTVVLGLITLVIGLLPFAVIFGIPGYFFVRYLRRRSARIEAEKNASEENAGIIT